MLEAAFKALFENGEQIRIAHVHCAKCDNIFFVSANTENEPYYCAYCGIKFVFYEKDNSGKKYSLGGRLIEEET